MTGQPGPTLVVTNDFPPRLGGIEAYVAQVCAWLGEVVVLTSSEPGSAAADERLPYPVHRLATRTLLPNRATAQAAVALLHRTGARRVVFGAAAPLGLLAPRLRAAGADHLVGLTHGHEVWWARLPPTAAALRRIGAGLDVVGHISHATAAAIGPALAPADRHKLTYLPPPVDTARFAPSDSVVPSQRPRVVAAGRFVAYKGWDVLLAAWRQALADPAVAALSPVLEVVGDGRLRPRLERAAARFASPAGSGGASVVVRGPVSHTDMPAVYAGARAFALPVRSRAFGLEPEGFGLVFAEAAAAGLPVLVGRSGGAVETVDPGRTGWCLPSRDVAAWAGALRAVVRDPDRAHRYGSAGRARVQERYDVTRWSARMAAAVGR